ncbi:MAG: cyclophilin-like fold protein [Eubacteriales bacterium]|nr:cyclophilin-like fold protein [Eubacteriales bacterium]
MKKRSVIFAAAVLLFGIGIATGAVEGYGAKNQKEQSQEIEKENSIIDEKEGAGEDNVKNAEKMTVLIGNTSFIATLEKNAAAEELLEMMQEGPVTISMRDYSGFEKVGSLGKSLTTNNRQTTTKSGDIVLYNGNQVVVFYGSNSWSYTRLAKIDDLEGWEEALGSGDLSITFALEE